MSEHEKPKAPRGLKAAGKRLWNDITGEWDLRPDELRVLADAARQADLIERIENELPHVPLIVQGSQGQEVIQPLISEIRQQRATLASLLRQLKLAETGEEETTAAPSGPMTRSEAARKAAKAKWSRAKNEAS